jgi:hypothetical protein
MAFAEAQNEQQTFEKANQTFAVLGYSEVGLQDRA